MEVIVAFHVSWPGQGFMRGWQLCIQHVSLCHVTDVVQWKVRGNSVVAGGARTKLNITSDCFLDTILGLFLEFTPEDFCMIENG